MPGAAEQEDTLAARSAESRKIVKHSYLVPPASAALSARMLAGQPDRRLLGA